MDFITGLPRTPRQKDTILVVVDHLSKMGHFITTKETVEAPQVVDLFIQNVFRLHGLPVSIVLDRDVRFCGHFWRHIFANLNVTLNISSGDHPQTTTPRQMVRRKGSTKYSRICYVLMYLIGRHIGIHTCLC